MYAPIAPVLLPFAAMFFVIGAAVWRYQVLFVYTRAYESNGAWWPHMAMRILCSLALGHATLAGVLALKLSGAVPHGAERWSITVLAGPALLPLPISVAVFARHYRRRFGAVFRRIPLSCAAEMGDSDSGLAFAAAYVTPCMLAPEALEAAEPEAWCLPEPYGRVARNGMMDEEESAPEGDAA